jgi:dUTPase
MNLKGITMTTQSWRSTLSIIWTNILRLKNFLVNDHGDLQVLYRNINNKQMIISSLHSCGIDFQLPKTFISANTAVQIPLGIIIEQCPRYIKPSILSRSSTNMRIELDIPVGTGDCDYRGEYKVTIRNTSDYDIVIEENERLVQMVFEFVLPQFYVKCVNTNAKVIDRIRGVNGFGSSDKYL